MVRWEGEEIEFVDSRRDVSNKLLARVHGSIDEDDVAAAKGAKEVNCTVSLMREKEEEESRRSTRTHIILSFAAR